MSRAWRVHHAALRGAPGERIALEPEEAHHVRRVLRLREGEPIRVFDGRGAEWAGTIARAAGSGVEIVLERPVPGEVEARLEVVLHQGACRPERIDWVVQKATEVGIHTVRIVQAARSEGGARRLERWARIALEAAKQSGRRRIPAVDAVGALPEPPPGVEALLLSTDPAAPPLGSRLGGPAPVAVWLGVGPEAGFAPAELEAAVGSGWHPVSLGPRVLRAETAGLVAAAIVLHAWADLGGSPAGPAV